MRRTIVVIAGLALLAVLAAVPIAQAAEAPSLPETQMLFDSNRTGNYEIFAMPADGGSPRQITEDPVYDSWWPKLSKDRTQIMFHRSPKGTHDRDYAKTSIWMVGVDGTGLRQVVPNRAYGWELIGHPEWSPDGTEIVLFAGKLRAPQIYILDADGTSPRAVTNRVGQNLDPSWSPDGQSILFVGCPGSICPHTSYEIYRIRRDGTGETRLTNDVFRDHDPYYSPDGSRIAWLRLGLNWGISSMAADGSDQRGVISDLSINSKPAWAVDGSWIYFHRTSLGRLGFNVFRIRPDGTGMQELISRPLIGFGPYDNEYPVHGHL